MQVVDATCPLVAKVHHEVHRFTKQGYQVLLIGRRGHDETEGTMGEVDGMTLVETPEDVASLEVDDPGKVAYITQTTLSPRDVADVVDALLGSLIPRRRAALGRYLLRHPEPTGSRRRHGRRMRRHHRRRLRELV